MAPLSDRYSVLGPLAQGGMAAIYLARRKGPEGFERIIALKSLGLPLKQMTPMLGSARLKPRAPADGKERERDEL